MFKLTKTTIFSYNFIINHGPTSWSDFYLSTGRLRLQIFFTGRVRWSDFSMGRLHLKAIEPTLVGWFIDIERRDWPFPDISRCMQTWRPSWVGAPKTVATCKQSGRCCVSCGKT